MFRFHSDSPAFFVGILMIGMILAVGGSVFATSVGTSISVSSTLTVSGTATSTYSGGIISNGFAGGPYVIAGVGQFSTIQATSTISLADGTAVAPSLTFTTDADTGLFSVSANILGFATGGSQRAVIDASGNVGIGTSTPGSLLALGTMANFVSNGTSTLANGLNVGRFSATSTVATTTISTGGFQVGQAGALAAFTVGQSATTSVGVGTSTVTSHQFGVGGNALIGAGGNGTSTLTISAEGTGALADRVGSCIELTAADGGLVRIYASSSVMTGVYTNLGLAMPGRNLVVEAGGCR